MRFKVIDARKPTRLMAVLNACVRAKASPPSTHGAPGQWSCSLTPPPRLGLGGGDGMRKGQSRKHLKERRCVIPCEGFYESRDEGDKQPYYFSRKDGKPLMLAGIWEI